VRSRNGFGSRMSPATVRAWEISPYVMTSAWTTFLTMWKNRGLVSKDMCAFLVSLDSIQVKK
jgi:hypothetical protein